MGRDERARQEPHDALDPLAAKGLPGVQAIGGGRDMTCARQTTSGAVWCWGNDDWGQLGYGIVAPPSTAPVTVQTPPCSPTCK